MLQSPGYDWIAFAVADVTRGVNDLPNGRHRCPSAVRPSMVGLETILTRSFRCILVTEGLGGVLLMVGTKSSFHVSMVTDTVSLLRGIASVRCGHAPNQFSN